MGIVINLIVYISLIIAGGFGCLVLMRWWRIRQLKKDRVTSRKCVCGYLLEHLEVPRCPECGTMVGFAKGTRPEDLGLTEGEMRAFVEAKKRGRG